MSQSPLLDRIDASLPDALDRLFALLRIPSISTDPAHAGDCTAAADWLVDELSGLGFEAARHATPGHPMVVARTPALAQGYCFTAIMTCSLLIRCRCGIPPRFSLNCKIHRAARSFARAGPRMTRGS